MRAAGSRQAGRGTVARAGEHDEPCPCLGAATCIQAGLLELRGVKGEGGARPSVLLPAIAALCSYHQSHSSHHGKQQQRLMGAENRAPVPLGGRPA